MVKIRLRRTGRKNRPYFRIVVSEARTKMDGKFIEKIGHYDPFIEEPDKKIKIEMERYNYWVSKGAQPTDKLIALLKHAKILKS